MSDIYGDIAKGFTLVELLVVMAIVAILSVVGIVAFSSVQKNARDARRRLDIDAIAKALEINRSTSGYIDLQGSHNFTSGAIPYDPKASGPTDYTVTGCGSGSGSTNQCWYCLKFPTLVPGYCDTVASGNGSVSNTTISSNPLFSSGWIVCANLESGNPAYYCKGSSQ